MPRRIRNHPVAAAMIMAAACTIAPALAGDLNPPAGAVAPTMKTLQEVEPRTPIHQSDIPLTIFIPGSYYLTENLVPTGVGDPAVITIVVSDVTLDLRGFSIDCTTEVSTANDGIRIDGVKHVTVTNGLVRDAQNSNVDAANSTGCRFSALRLRDATAYNLVASHNVSVEDCHAEGAATGIFTGDDCTIRNCVATANSSAGIRCGLNSAVSGSVASANGGDGFVAGSGCSFEACVAANNSGDGFDGDDNDTFRTCTARANGRSGFNLESDCAYDGCVADGNDVLGLGSAQLDGSFNTSIRSCVVNGDEGVGDGIGCESGEIIGCTVRSCGDDGIRMNGPGGIRDCTADLCGGDGIQITTGCIVERCNARSNGAAGIHATFQGNLIRDNLCRANLRGIDVDSTANTIIRNRCQINDGGAGDYDVAGGNTFAPVNPNPNVAGPWDNM